MRCEYQQIPAAGVPGRLRGRLPGCARTCPQIQPQEVHPASTPGLPGAQGVLAPRLPRAGRAPRRPPRPLPPDRTEGRPPLHHLPEGGAAAAGGRARPSHVRRRARASAASIGCGSGGSAWRPSTARGWSRDTSAATTPSGSADGRSQWGQDLRALPQGRLRGRLRQPPDPAGGPGSRAGLRTWCSSARPSVRRPAARGSAPSWPMPTSTPNGFMSTSAPTASARSSHRTRGRPTDKPPDGPIGGGDEAEVRHSYKRNMVRVAGGDRELDDQAAPRLGPARRGLKGTSSERSS